MKALLSLLLFIPLLHSCKTYSDEDMKAFDREINAYVEKNKLECQRSSSGLYYQIIEEGEGKPILFTNVVSFTYKGTFLNGDVFDEQKKPVEFEVRQLIGAWKEIMLNLKPGGKAFLIAPPQLGYGDRELDDIPANSILVYEIEVHGVK